MKFYREFIIMKTKTIFKDKDDACSFERNKQNLLVDNMNGCLTTKTMIEALLMNGVLLDREREEVNRLRTTTARLYCDNSDGRKDVEIQQLTHSLILCDEKIFREKNRVKDKEEKIKLLNEIIENDKEIIAKLNKKILEIERNKQNGLIKNDVLINENFVNRSKDEIINERFKMLKDLEVDNNKLVKAFNLKSIKSFEQLENENKSLRGQIKKQASVIKDLKSIKSKSRIEENKTNAYVEKLALKNSSLNEKLINQSNIIGELVEFKKLYQNGIFVKTSPEQVGIVTIAQDELNNLRCENEDMKKTISELHKSNGLLQDFKKEIVETLCCVKSWDIENLKIDDIIIKEIIGGLK